MMFIIKLMVKFILNFGDLRVEGFKTNTTCNSKVVGPTIVHYLPGLALTLFSPAFQNYVNPRGGGGFRPPTMISSPEHILQAITLFISFLDSPIKYLAGHIHFFVIAWKMLWQWPIFERHFFSKMSEKSQICEISVRKTIDSRPKKLPCYKMTYDKKMKVPLLCI